MKKRLRLLDCTLRDGGYYNNWDFSDNLISKYLKSMAATGIEFVEIGFRSFEKKLLKVLVLILRIALSKIYLSQII